MDKVYVLTNDNGAVIEVLSEESYRDKQANEVDELFSDCESTEDFADWLDREYAPSDLWSILAIDTGRENILNEYKQVLAARVESDFTARYQECEVE